ncbi:long-chain fatty acid transporter-like protein [Microdochium bolleyi]|uniref:Very long-chain fatty acid transport protein n=1 Tax=Microdochium bolleyi TaxID=196109 RepID=A0A136JJC2_9PEZI|nr:long-chain fatty acid transporter-like protein [Microdochium bolleyi]
MAATIAASVGATAAAAAYLDAKLHLSQDWQDLRARNKGKSRIAQLMRKKQISAYYAFERSALAAPAQQCIWSRKGCYTYAEAYSRVHQYGHFFRSHGVGPGDLVALFMENSPDFALAWLGLWSIGAAPALINHNLTSQALLHCLKIAGTKIILADGRPDLLERLDAVRTDLAEQQVEIVQLSEIQNTLNSMSVERPPDELRANVTPTSPFGLLYTSGTTGMPKAGLIPMIAGTTAGVSRECGFSIVKGTGQRYYVCMPMYHGTGGISGMTQLLTGQTLLIAPKFSVSGFWDDIRTSEATWFAYVGETLRYLLAAPPSPLDKSHKVQGIYGNGLRPDVWKAFRDRFGITTVFEFFNSTEGVLSFDNRCRGDFRAHAVGHHGWLYRRRFRDTYVPVEIDADTGDLIRDPKTGFVKRVAPEQGGEILVAQGTPLVPTFGGYYGNKEATESKFVYNVFKKGDKYFRTGDALRRDSDGRWFFMDRLGDTFRWKGENVSTAEVSQVLGQYPGVSEAIVYGVSLPNHDGKAGMASIFLDESVQNFDYAGLLKHTRKHLPKYAVPLFIRHIKTRAATHNNKQDKAPLRKAGIDHSQVGGDPLYWVENLGKGDNYVPFTEEDGAALQAGRAKL